MISKIIRMKTGTKIGWLLIAFSILLSIWVIISQSARADVNLSNGLVLNDEGDTVIGYTGTDTEISASFFAEGGGTIVTIGNEAFAGKNITSIELPPTIASIGEGAFSGCGNLTNIAMSETIVPIIPANAFANCTNLTSISLPATVNNIAANAFLNCGSMTSCEIPANANFDPEAFKGCYSLSAYKYGSGTANYQVAGGCVYDATGVTLLRVAPGLARLDPANILATCTTIGEGAFSANSSIEVFTIPGTVTTIAPNAFAGSGIKGITIPATVTTIGTQDNWTSLKDVYGASNSAAELWSTEMLGTGVTFHVVGDNGDVVVPDNPNNPTNPDNPNKPNNNTGNNTTTGNGTNTGTGTVVNGGSSTTATSTGKDSTPKTADGDFDARWFAIIGAFMAGLAIVFYTRQRKFEIITVKKESDLDS